MLFNEADLQDKLQKTIDRFIDELKKIRTGRATMDMFDNIEVEAYGVMNKLTAVSNVVIEDAMNVKVNFWDKGVASAIEEALRESGIGASVISEKDHLRLKFSPLTEETRKDAVKDLKQILEDFKVRVRKIRQDFMQALQSLEGVSEDEQKRDEESIQKTIDENIARLDDIAKNKEGSILTV